ncbi:MAG: hypothetical protein O2800_00285 [Planctomycetota bacterium]|nr:hypothetical protein [Planctomycetota bacterium]
MAIRSSGGSGLIASLILFVITTVGLIVGVVLLFNANGALERTLAERENELNSVYPASVKSRTDVARLKNAAGGSPLVGFLADERGQIGTFVASNPDAGIDDMRTALKITGTATAMGTLNDLRTAVETRDKRIAALTADVETAQAGVESARDELAQARAAFTRGAEEIRADLAKFTDITEQFSAGLSELRDSYTRNEGDLRADFDARRAELETQLDEANQRRASLEEKTRELQAVVSASRVRAKDAAELVDARVIEVSPDGRTVYIDLGRRDRLRPGMTFELYADAALIGQDSNGSQSAGKASVEVTRVGDTTSQARVTRLQPRASVSRNDILANAIYSPDHEYRFIVHGLFDVDGDGTPSQAETDFVKQRIIDWNGTIVDGDRLAGDVDFVVIGVRPTRAPQPALDATDAEFASFAAREEVRERYESLMQAGSEAQIPILNWNRLQVLTGASDR